MKAAIAAALALAWARVAAYFAENWLPFTLRFGIPLVMLVVLAIGWADGTPWTRTLMVLSAAFVGVVVAEVSGKLPAFKS